MSINKSCPLCHAAPSQRCQVLPGEWLTRNNHHLIRGWTVPDHFEYLHRVAHLIATWDWHSLPRGFPYTIIEECC